MNCLTETNDLVVCKLRINKGIILINPLVIIPNEAEIEVLETLSAYLIKMKQEPK